MVAMFSQPPAIERAVELYVEHGLLLATDLQNYLRHPLGYVVKNPDLVLLFRPIRLEDPGTWLETPGEGDAWYVRLLVGPMRQALREMPHTLPYIAWHRNFRAGPEGRLHTARTETFIKKARKYHGR